MDNAVRVEKLKYALANGSSILKLASGYNIDYKEGAEYLVLHETVVGLAALDPRLPLAIDAMLAQRQTCMMGPEAIRNTLYYWSDPLKIRADNERTVIKNVAGIDHYDSETMIASVAASGYDLHRVGKVEYVDLTKWGMFAVHHDELDKHFPGWLKRFEVARGIGLEEEAVTAHVFQQPEKNASTISVEMTPVTF
jgi:hypothetical protein